MRYLLCLFLCVCVSVVCVARRGGEYQKEFLPSLRQDKSAYGLHARVCVSGKRLFTYASSARAEICAARSRMGSIQMLLAWSDGR